MSDNETNNNSLVPIYKKGLIKVGKIIKITDKVLKKYSERALSEFYKSVIIGEQEWMVENLNVDHFRNGDPIPEAKTNEEWIKAGEEQRPAWCYYDNDPKNGKRYGKLYNWYAVNDPRGLAPEGWNVPSFNDWKKLIDCLGGSEISGYKMKATNGWNNSGNGNNKSGFTALPGGVHGYAFIGIGNEGYWWSSNENEKEEEWAWDRYITYFSGNANKSCSHKTVGISVRCIKDKILF